MEFLFISLLVYITAFLQFMSKPIIFMLEKNKKDQEAKDIYFQGSIKRCKYAQHGRKRAQMGHKSINIRGV